MATEKTGLIPERARVKEIEAYYYKTQVLIGKELIKIDIVNYKEMQAIAIQKRTNKMVDDLNRFAIRWTKKSIPESYDDAGTKARTSLSVLGALRDENYNRKIHPFTIREFEDDTINDYIRANISIRNNVSMFLYLSRQASRGLMQIQEFDIGDEALIDSIIVETMTLGEARGFASSKIYEMMRLKLLDGKFIERNGRNYNLRDYSKMVARTKMRECQSQAVKNNCNEFQNDLVQFSEHADSCEICAPFEGNIYSLSGTHPTYDQLPELPPLHPNCEHDISPTSEVAIGFRERFQ